MIKAGILNALVPMNRDSMFQAGLSHILSDGVLAGIGDNCRVELNTVKTGACLLRVTRTTVAPVETFLIPVEITADETIDTSGNGYIILRADAGKINDGTTITTLDGSGIVTLEKVSVLPANNYLLLATLAGGVITNNTETARVQNSSQSKRGFYGVSVGSANALAVTIANLPALEDGVTIQVKANAENTGDATINVNGTGALPIRKAFNQVLSAADIKTNMVLQLTYNETSNIWQAVSVASVGPTNVDMVSVSPTDTTPNYLNNKLSIGSGLSGSVLNPGGNEVIQINNPYDGKSVDIQEFTTPGTHTWVKPAGAKIVEVRVIGGGGGGSVGGYGDMGNYSNRRISGSGGGGGGYNSRTYKSSELSATEQVVVGAKGIKGTTMFANGGNGGNSYFSLVANLRTTGYGGMGGVFSIETSGQYYLYAGRGGRGGGRLGNNPNAPAGELSNPMSGGRGGGVYPTSPNSPDLYSTQESGGYGGGGGGGGRQYQATGGAGNFAEGGVGMYGAGGGGAGGQSEPNFTTGFRGGNNLGAHVGVNTTTTGGGGNYGNTLNGNGGDGAHATGLLGEVGGAGQGGGGGAQIDASGVNGNGGNGGNGGYPGGGGGGGGSYSMSGNHGIGGHGGDGADGKVVVITYF